MITHERQVICERGNEWIEWKKGRPEAGWKEWTGRDQGEVQLLGQQSGQIASSPLVRNACCQFVHVSSIKSQINWPLGELGRWRRGCHAIDHWIKFKRRLLLLMKTSLLCWVRFLVRKIVSVTFFSSPCLSFPFSLSLFLSLSLLFPLPQELRSRGERRALTMAFFAWVRVWHKLDGRESMMASNSHLLLLRAASHEF